MSHNFYVRTHVNFPRVNNIEAMYGRRRVNNFYVYARPSIHCLLDFLKNLRFPFPVPVVGPSTKDFYPLQCAKFTGEISLLWVLSNHERFYWCAVNQTRSRHMKRDVNCFDPNSVDLCIFCWLYFDFFYPLFSNSSLQNDVTWCNFLQWKQVELPVSRSLLPQKTKKNLPLALRPREKIWARLVGKSNCLYSTYLHALNLRAYVHKNYATKKMNPWEKFQNLRGFVCKTTQPWLGGKSCFFLYKS